MSKPTDFMTEFMTERTRGTVCGFGAILMWSTLALFTAGSGKMPPFQLLAVSFALAAGVVALALRARGMPLAPLFRLPARVWLLGVGGLFGYHALYFFALRNAPTAQASLTAYLWPLLTVLFSAFLPGERLRWFHIAGCVSGFCGAGLLFFDANNAGAGAGETTAVGIAAAACAAVVWAGYSALSRLVARYSSAVVMAFLSVSAVLGAAAHLAFETATVLPATAGQWAAVVLLGLAPVGGACFLWDIGVKRGNIMLLGALSYLAPLFSTALLVAFGFAGLTWQIVAACVLISGGALLAAKK